MSTAHPQECCMIHQHNSHSTEEMLPLGATNNGSYPLLWHVSSKMWVAGLAATAVPVYQAEDKHRVDGGILLFLLLLVCNPCFGIPTIQAVAGRAGPGIWCQVSAIR